MVDKKILKSCANITGGGLYENIKRIIPKGLVADIDLKEIKTKKIFKWIKNYNVNDKEMLKTFNCGVGFCLVIKEKNFNKVKKIFSKEFQPYKIGEIKTGNNKVSLNGKIVWK